MAIQVFVVHEALLYREGLAYLLGKHEDMSEVGAGSNSDDLSRSLIPHHFRSSS